MMENRDFNYNFKTCGITGLDENGPHPTPFLHLLLRTNEGLRAEPSHMPLVSGNLLLSLLGP